jgi:hypothetical protein
LADLGQFEAALDSHDRALVLNPSYSEAHTNRGNALTLLNRLEEAVASYDRAIAIEPDDAVTHYNRALGLLLAGDFERGWREHEWRWKMEHFSAVQNLEPAIPPWRGEESLAGKTILLRAEQGFGDTLQFCRYATLVRQLGARVILQAPKVLCRVLTSLAGVERVIAETDAPPPCDFHCSLLSLPLAMRTTLATVPAAVPYLWAGAEERDYWQRRLGERSRARIGVVWAGGFRPNQSAAVTERRNIALSKLAPLEDVDADFFSLQKGEPASSELVRLRGQGWPGPRLRDHADELRDFADTAGLIEQLDLIVSVDTATAHLASALGKPVWLLNRFDTCWRWLIGRRTSPWYPSLRLYRQPQPGDWDSVVSELHRDLTAWVARGQSHVV